MLKLLLWAMEIIIQPVLTEINDNTVVDLVNGVSREFEGIRVTMARDNDTTLDSEETSALQYLFDTNRIMLISSLWTSMHIHMV